MITDNNQEIPKKILYTVETKMVDDEMIIINTYQAEQREMTAVIETREYATCKALIALGWTPPERVRERMRIQEVRGISYIRCFQDDDLITVEQITKKPTPTTHLDCVGTTGGKASIQTLQP